MFFRNGRNLSVNAEHRTVVQKLGSRGVVVKRSLYTNMMEINEHSIRQIDEQSMKNRCNVDIRKEGKVSLEYQGKWGNLLEFLLKPLIVWLDFYIYIYIEITFALRIVPL